MVYLRKEVRQSCALVSSRSRTAVDSRQYDLRNGDQTTAFIPVNMLARVSKLI